jgi:hypothetical protein
MGMKIGGRITKFLIASLTVAAWFFPASAAESPFPFVKHVAAASAPMKGMARHRPIKIASTCFQPSVTGKLGGTALVILGVAY